MKINNKIKLIICMYSILSLYDISCSNLNNDWLYLNEQLFFIIFSLKQGAELKKNEIFGIILLKLNQLYKNFLVYLSILDLEIKNILKSPLFIFNNIFLKTKKKRILVLKSPHINKTARESFILKIKHCLFYLKYSQEILIFEGNFLLNINQFLSNFDIKIFLKKKYKKNNMNLNIYGRNWYINKIIAKIFDNYSIKKFSKDVPFYIKNYTEIYWLIRYDFIGVLKRWNAAQNSLEEKYWYAMENEEGKEVLFKQGFLPWIIASLFWNLSLGFLWNFKAHKFAIKKIDELKAYYYKFILGQLNSYRNIFLSSLWKQSLRPLSISHKNFLKYNPSKDDVDKLISQQILEFASIRYRFSTFALRMFFRDECELQTEGHEIFQWSASVLSFSLEIDTSEIVDQIADDELEQMWYHSEWLATAERSFLFNIYYKTFVNKVKEIQHSKIWNKWARKDHRKSDRFWKRLIEDIPYYFLDKKYLKMISTVPDYTLRNLDFLTQNMYNIKSIDHWDDFCDKVMSRNYFEDLYRIYNKKNEIVISEMTRWDVNTCTKWTASDVSQKQEEYSSFSKLTQDWDGNLDYKELEKKYEKYLEKKYIKKLAHNFNILFAIKNKENSKEISKKYCFWLFNQIFPSKRLVSEFTYHKSWEFWRHTHLTGKWGTHDRESVSLSLCKRNKDYLTSNEYISDWTWDLEWNTNNMFNSLFEDFRKRPLTFFQDEFSAGHGKEELYAGLEYSRKVRENDSSPTYVMKKDLLNIYNTDLLPLIFTQFIIRNSNEGISLYWPKKYLSCFLREASDHELVIITENLVPKYPFNRRGGIFGFIGKIFSQSFIFFHKIGFWVGYLITIYVTDSVLSQVIWHDYWEYVWDYVTIKTFGWYAWDVLQFFQYRLMFYDVLIRNSLANTAIYSGLVKSFGPYVAEYYYHYKIEGGITNRHDYLIHYISDLYLNTFLKGYTSIIEEYYDAPSGEWELWEIQVPVFEQPFVRGAYLNWDGKMVQYHWDNPGRHLATRYHQHIDYVNEYLQHKFDYYFFEHEMGTWGRGIFERHRATDRGVWHPDKPNTQVLIAPINIDLNPKLWNGNPLMYSQTTRDEHLRWFCYPFSVVFFNHKRYGKEFGVTHDWLPLYRSLKNVKYWNFMKPATYLFWRNWDVKLLHDLWYGLKQAHWVFEETYKSVPQWVRDAYNQIYIPRGFRGFYQRNTGYWAVRSRRLVFMDPKALTIWREHEKINKERYKYTEEGATTDTRQLWDGFWDGPKNFGTWYAPKIWWRRYEGIPRGWRRWQWGHCDQFIPPIRRFYNNRFEFTWRRVLDFKLIFDQDDYRKVKLDENLFDYHDLYTVHQHWRNFYFWKSQRRRWDHFDRVTSRWMKLYGYKMVNCKANVAETRKFIQGMEEAIGFQDPWLLNWNYTHGVRTMTLAEHNYALRLTRINEEGLSMTIQNYDSWEPASLSNWDERWLVFRARFW